MSPFFVSWSCANSARVKENPGNLIIDERASLLFPQRLRWQSPETWCRQGEYGEKEVIPSCLHFLPILRRQRNIGFSPNIYFLFPALLKSRRSVLHRQKGNRVSSAWLPGNQRWNPMRVLRSFCTINIRVSIVYYATSRRSGSLGEPPLPLNSPIVIYEYGMRS